MSHKKYLILLIPFIVFSIESSACDACGCAMTGNYAGIYPQFTKNILGVRFGNRRFNHPNTELNFNGSSQVLSDEFNTVEIWGRFYPTPKVQVFATVPFRVHTRSEAERTTRLRGVGDISISANYTLFNSADSSKSALKHALLIGGGVFMPTGKFMQRDDRLVSLPAQFQLGTGAFSFSLNANYTLRKRNWGLNIDGQARLSEENERSYEFGNLYAAVASVFYKLEKGTVAILPNVGASFENYERDQEFDRSKEDTGGNVILINAGVDVYLPKFSFNFSAQLPIEQSLPYSQPASSNRINVGIAYTF